MTTGNDDALDVALGLLRAPALRAALRSRPLPQGVGEVLAIASGSVDAARGAARRTGHGEAELVEASRFYVQQVLLAEGADAYRVLGAGRDAAHAVLRDHHRLLLRWLHPDRSEGAQWDSALSTRVNQAWNQLRSEAARRQYDAGLPSPEAGAPVASTASVHSYPPIGTPLTVSLEEVPASRWSTSAPPVAVGLLGLLCVVLAWLAFTREDAFEPLGDEARAPVAAATDASDAADVPGPSPSPSATLLPEIEVRPSPALPVRGMEVTSIASVQTMAPPPPPAALLAQAAGPAPPMPGPMPDTEAAPTPTPTPPPMPAPVPAPATATATATATLPAAAAPPEDPLQLFLEAEDAIRGITDWLAVESTPDPAWQDLPTRLESEGERGRLQARHEGRTPVRMQVDAPNWSLGSRAASMSGAYRVDARRGTVETGMLQIELTRRDGQWRVSGLQLEPAR